MKSVATALALNLLVANAFVAQTSKHVMQPLHADYMNRLSNQGGPAVQTRGGNAPFDSNNAMGQQQMQQNNNQRGMQQNNNQRGMQQNNNQRGMQQNNNQRGMQQNNNQSGMQQNNQRGMQQNNNQRGMQQNNMQRNDMQRNDMQRNNMQQNNNQRAMQPNTRTPALDEKYSPVNGAYPTVQSTANTPFRPPRYDTERTTMSSGGRSTQDIFYDIIPVEVQGGSLKTCAFAENVSRATVLLKTTGRPLNANVELWQGPDNAPQKMSVYLEDGELRPFRATIETNGSANAVAIRNTGQMEFPLTAGIECDMSQSVAPSEMLLANTKFRTVQGGAVYTTPFPPAVQSVQIALRTDGRPLTARVELLQGPNNNKQVMEVYTEDGSERPFYVIVDTPGAGNVVRIVNTATVEFPLTAATEAYIIDDSVDQQTNMNGAHKVDEQTRIERLKNIEKCFEVHVFE